MTVCRTLVGPGVNCPTINQGIAQEHRYIPTEAGVSAPRSGTRPRVENIAETPILRNSVIQVFIYLCDKRKSPIKKSLHYLCDKEKHLWYNPHMHEHKLEEYFQHLSKGAIPDEELKVIIEISKYPQSKLLEICPFLAEKTIEEVSHLFWSAGGYAWSRSRSRM